MPQTGDMDEVKIARRRAKTAARNRRWRRKQKTLQRHVKRHATGVDLFDDYDGLIAAIKRRRQALGLRQLAMDARTGLPDGYQGKLECGAKRFGPLSLHLVLQVLGLKIMVVPAEEGVRK